MTDFSKKQIGNYELLDLLGDGAQGRVFRARCIVDNNPNIGRDEIVALKILRYMGVDSRGHDRFQRQADILRGLSHENIVKYRDSFVWHGEWDETRCLVMEFLDGETLQARLDSKTPGSPAWDELRNIFEQCLEGLIYARGQGIVHRDLKPSNIFITRKGAVKLIDFGIARREDAGQTSTSGWRGAFDFMAPDFVTIDNFHGDEISDVFSLGVCFYRALTGRLPFPRLGESAHIGYLNRWRTEPAVDPSFRSGIFRILTPHCRELVRKSLSPKRESRYTGFAQMLKDLRSVKRRAIKGSADYELFEFLGQGGFGEVYKARRLNDDMPVAVKWLSPDRQTRRFLREARLLQQSRHEHIVQYIDFIELKETGDRKYFFLVMEFLSEMPEWSLRNRIKRKDKGLKTCEALELFSHYLEALQYLHEHDIIHRDIKPGNLYAPAGALEKAKIFDLGIARDLSGTQTTGPIFGTLDYMPPEFVGTTRDRGSPQSDIYSLGVSFYEALTGKIPFSPLPTEEKQAVEQFVARARGPDTLKVDYDISPFTEYPELADIVHKSIVKEPANRYQCAAEMREEINKCLKEAGAASLPAGTDNPDETKADLPTAETASRTNHVQTVTSTGAARRVTPETVLRKTGEMLTGSTKLRERLTEFLREKRTRTVGRRLPVAAGLLIATVCAGFAVLMLLPRSRERTERIEEPSATAGTAKLAETHPPENPPAPPAIEEKLFAFSREIEKEKGPQFLQDADKNSVTVKAGPSVAKETAADIVFEPVDEDVNTLDVVLPGPSTADEPGRPVENSDDIRVEHPEFLSEQAALETVKPDEAVAEYLGWLYQVEDPELRSYRYYTTPPPSVSFSLLPAHEERTDGPDGPDGQLERLRYWEKSGPLLRRTAARRKLAEDLSHCAGKLRKKGNHTLAARCEMESAILKAGAGEFASGYDDIVGPPEILKWRAHARYFPRMSALDVLDDLAAWVKNKGTIDEYDLRLALYAAYYTWYNAIAGEHEYAGKVDKLLGTILNSIDKSSILTLMTFLSTRESSVEIEETKHPCLYMIEAISLMPALPHDSELKRQARQWLFDNSKDKLVQRKREQVKSAVVLLARLLRHPESGSKEE